MTTLSADTFLDLVERSGLVEDAPLRAALSQLERQGVAAGDTEAVAKGLIEAGLFTRWQCDKLLEGRHHGFFLGKYKLLGHLGHRRDEQRLPGRARADAAAGGDQGAAQAPGG